jgi:hypothetical protein
MSTDEDAWMIMEIINGIKLFRSLQPQIVKTTNPPLLHFLISFLLMCLCSMLNVKDEVNAGHVRLQVKSCLVNLVPPTE